MTDGLRVFDGGVAIVTGAGSGIGRAISETLARRGSRVVLADVDLGDAEAAAAEIRATGGGASAKRLDVSRFEDFRRLVHETAAECGRLDFVFNNAGIGVLGEIADYTMEAWDQILGINLNGVIHGVQSAYPLMVRQGFGHIVNTASMAGLTIAPGMVSYTTTKHAVVALSRALRAEARFHGIRVSALCPGVIRTPLLRGGKHGIFLAPAAEEAQRDFAGDVFERLRPMPVSAFARKALDRVARNQEIIIVPAWWRALWWLERVSPAAASFLARKGYERGRRFLVTGGLRAPG